MRQSRRSHCSLLCRSSECASGPGLPHPNHLHRALHWHNLGRPGPDRRSAVLAGLDLHCRTTQAAKLGCQAARLVRAAPGGGTAKGRVPGESLQVRPGRVSVRADSRCSGGSAGPAGHCASHAAWVPCPAGHHAERDS